MNQNHSCCQLHHTPMQDSGLKPESATKDYFTYLGAHVQNGLAFVLRVTGALSSDQFIGCFKGGENAPTNYAFFFDAVAGYRAADSVLRRRRCCSHDVRGSCFTHIAGHWDSPGSFRPAQTAAHDTTDSVSSIRAHSGADHRDHHRYRAQTAEPSCELTPHPQLPTTSERFQPRGGE